MLTKDQIRKLSKDTQLLKAFEKLVNAKLKQWQASREFELTADAIFDTLERRLSSFCVIAHPPYRAETIDLKEFLQDLAFDDEWQGFEVREFEVIETCPRLPWIF